MSVPIPKGQELADIVVATIAEVTRYPKSILLPASELEDDLGIESVKRAEIMGVLGQRLELPPPTEGSELVTLKTIADVIAAVERALASRTNSPAMSSTIPTPISIAAVPIPAPRPQDHLIDLVTATITEVMRKPQGPLRAESELERELGIEPAKRAEIMGVLGQQLGFSPPQNGGLSGLKTIGDVVAAVQTLSAAPSSRTASIAASVGTEAPKTLKSPALPTAPPPPAPPAIVPPKMPTPTPQAKQPATPEPKAAVPVVRTPSPIVMRSAPSAEPFAGKVALVMGSGRGMGKTIAQHLARLGSSVVVNSFHSPEEGASTVAALAAEGRDVIHAWGSSANSEQLDDIIASVQGRYGHLDFLVWNASDARTAPLASLTPDDWDRAFRTDVVGFHRTAFRAAPLMAARGGGKMVTITHPASQRCFDEFAALGTVKAALESLSRYLAIELGPKNIQVNTVSAGPCQEHLDRYPNSARHIPRWESRAPGGVLPNEAAVAHAVAYLLSSDSNRMTGSIVTVDGGVLLST
jgi:enoyl-[acyl-carrier protein] reductase III